MLHDPVSRRCCSAELGITERRFGQAICDTIPTRRRQPLPSFPALPLVVLDEFLVVSLVLMDAYLVFDFVQIFFSQLTRSFVGYSTS